MRLVFTSQGWEDCCHWQQADRSILKRINRLLDDTLRTPTSGIGKPEPLKYGIAGAWSAFGEEEGRCLLFRSPGLLLVGGGIGPGRTSVSFGTAVRTRLPGRREAAVSRGDQIEAVALFLIGARFA